VPASDEVCLYISQAPVSWHSTLQSTVTLSTTEAEYMTVPKTIKEGILLQGLLNDLGSSMIN